MEENKAPKRGEGRRQIFRISILKKEQSAALEILNKCPKTLRGDLIAAAVVLYDKQIRQPTDGSNRPGSTVGKIATEEAAPEPKTSLTDLFRKVSI